MKNLKLVVLVLATGFLLSSCKKEINGSGHFVTQTRIVPSFNKVTSCGDFTVILIEDPVSRVVMNGEDNILPEIETDVSGNELKIYFDDHFTGYDHSGIIITIYNPGYSKVDLQGSGKIYSPDSLHTNSVAINLSGSGKIDLLLNTAFIESNISGSGAITLQGISPLAVYKISGSGNTHAFNMVSADVTAVISGSGVCRVQALNTLKATISGSGDIIYRGNPVVTKNISGSGEVKPE